MPTEITVESCRLELRVKRFTQPAQTEKFTLGDYFGALVDLDNICLVKGYSGGTADIGREGLFYAYLGGMKTPIPKGNRTVVREINEVAAK